MTLNLMIYAPWGIWQSADFRVCYLLPTGTVKPRPDWSVKHVSVRCPDGQLEITYSGVARVGYHEPGYPGELVTSHEEVKAGVAEAQERLGRFRELDVGEWLVRILHGRTRTVRQTIAHIREEASRASRFRNPTVPFPTRFVYGGYQEGKLIAGEVFNPQMPSSKSIEDVRMEDLDPNWQSLRPGREFLISYFEPGAPGTFTSSMRAAISEHDIRLLREMALREPTDPNEYLHELAEINRRAARSSASQGLISEECSVTYTPPDGSTRLMNQTWEKDPTIEISGVWLVHSGIDLHAIVKAAMAARLERVEFAFRHEQPEQDPGSGE